MTRITYRKVHDSFLSRQRFFAIDKLVVVLLDPANLNGQIIDHEQAVILKRFNANNLANLKKQAKKELVNLGVLFTPEVRPRLKGVKNDNAQS